MTRKPQCWFIVSKLRQINLVNKDAITNAFLLLATDEWTELLQVRMNSSRKTVSATLTVLPIRGHSGLTVHLRVRTEDGVVLDRMEKSIPIEVIRGQTIKL